MPKNTKKNAPKGSSVKLAFKKHVLPPLLGIGVTVLMLSFFNSQFIAGKFTQNTQKINAEASHQDAEIASGPLVADSDKPRLIINKLNITAPVDYTLKDINERNFQIALRSGVVHYPQTGIPGEPGNIVIFGHSSNQVWAKGDYKFVFAMLDKLVSGDTIIIEYTGKRYIYTVTNTKVVLPTDLSVLDATAEKRLTLITCTPVGSNLKRFIVEAVQTAPVDPEPSNEKPAPTVNEELYGKEQLPSSSSPSLWEEIKDLFN